jgi:hypothetical protein
MTINIEQIKQRFPGADGWWDRGGGLWRARLNNPSRQHLYVLVDERGAYAAAPASSEPLPGLEAEVRRVLAAEIDYQLLPACVVAGCEEKAPEVFKAAERGYLAGRRWERGDEIRTCPAHGHDIYMAQGVHGRHRLAEWLRPDAKLDVLDELDAWHDALHGHQIREDRGRMLWVAIRAR